MHGQKNIRIVEVFIFTTTTTTTTTTITTTIYLLTPCSRVLLEKLIGSAVKKFPEFLETEGSSPYSQVPATCPYPDYYYYYYYY